MCAGVSKLTSAALFGNISDIDITPQQPEINDQFETKTHKTNITNEIDITRNRTIKNRRSEVKDVQIHFVFKLLNVLKKHIRTLMSAPKISSVLRNVGTCMVNGAMEVISYYLPAPIMPLIAAAAGMMIPFEPVVMLKQRMPVTSYRRAFNTAMSTFMNTFNRYKFDYEEDPYMTRRFNRRFMKESGEKQER
ncbi:unnamed protein product [Parnassius apollo]|uniref:(apollo) hypothetical protein n=1 Tax=Parnassius apollo TaxID=110799 RepID=A0A8S3YAS3_PARAO|nr:unnamed protein product [Parnassius apollo]